MNRNQFNSLEADNILLMNNGRTRKILAVTKCFGERVHLKPRTSVTLKKISGRGTTVYVYGDLAHKVEGVYRIKPINAQDLNTYIKNVQQFNFRKHD